ncbi:MAG TPA: oligoendopeptidase F [bacterium]|nr:oligoendopeptidase F [bacterium]
MKHVEVLFMMLMLTSAGVVQSQTRPRAEVPLGHTWNTADLYPDAATWQKAKNELNDLTPAITAFQGKVAHSARDLYACLELRSELSRRFGRLSTYAGLLSDQDTRESEALAMRQEMSQIGVDLASRLAFIEPEIASLSSTQIDQFIAQEQGLKVYAFYLRDVLRRKAHKLSAEEEKIVAEAGLMSDAAYSTYSIFSNAELPYPQVKLVDGTSVLVDQAGYGRYRALPNREDRERVFQAFFSTLGQFRRTFGTQLYANVKRDMFYARVRRYENSLSAALDDNAIPVEVYHALVRSINQNLPTFHRYLRLRQRMLGVPQLAYHDLYAPVVKGVELQYNNDEARQLILDALAPLGEEYHKVVETAFSSRWIDLYPTTGKRSGAYSNGSAYDVHPYILMNYSGQYNDVSTLAHELGHALHSHFSNSSQPYPLADYPIFVAEVASTLNEALLIDHILKTIKDDDVRLSLLMSHLDGIKGTLFRQTQFAEFELAIHEVAERGETLTGDKLTELYRSIFRKYYGADEGICAVDDLYAMEWAYIPHFYYNYYVYQYSTAFTASTALSQKILNHEKGAVESYLAFISAGGSDYPIKLLQKAGVDMTTTAPFSQAMSAMNRTMDEIEKILDKRK